MFVYTVSGGFPGFPDQRTSYDSSTRELVFIDQRSLLPGQTTSPLAGNTNNAIKIIPLNDTVENKLKQVMRDNNIFSTKEIYYTEGFDLPVEKLFVVLDGKVHSVELNVQQFKPNLEPVPEGLVKIIDTIRNITSSK